MKLEFLPEGSTDCPLIRLYSFTRSEVLHLRQLVDKLSTGKAQKIALHDELGVEPVNGCRLFFSHGNRDQGIVQISPREFECVLSGEGWLDVSSLLEPFCATDASGFQWLSDHGPISLLISVKGTW